METLKEPVRAQGRADHPDTVGNVVDEIISAVAAEGDDAVRRYSDRFDGWTPGSFRLSRDEIAASVERVPAQVIDDIAFCQEQVRVFAEAQRATIVDLEVFAGPEPDRLQPEVGRARTSPDRREQDVALDAASVGEVNVHELVAAHRRGLDADADIDARLA